MTVHGFGMHRSTHPTGPRTIPHRPDRVGSGSSACARRQMQCSADGGRSGDVAVERGLAPAQAARLGHLMLSAMQGARVLCQAGRETAPLIAAAYGVKTAVQALRAAPAVAAMGNRATETAG